MHRNTVYSDEVHTASILDTKSDISLSSLSCLSSSPLFDWDFDFVAANVSGNHFFIDNQASQKCITIIGAKKNVSIIN